MKKLYIILGLVMFSAFLILGHNLFVGESIFIQKYQTTKKLSKEQRAKGQAEERIRMMTNLQKGYYDPNDWYEALALVMEKQKAIGTRAGGLEWKSLGPLDVGGRTRGFIFDNQNPNRCYASGVSGGIFVSDDLGVNFRPVEGFDQLPIKSIGCMAQSIEGDIYAGTGEYWGNAATGSYQSQFNGNGIYKKSKNAETFTLLPKTFFGGNFGGAISGGSTTAIPFKFVIDIACDPYNNDKVIAATDNGMWISIDGGDNWTKASGVMASGAISQIKPAKSAEGVWYAGRDGVVYKSTDGGSSWTAVVTNNAYIAESSNNRRHLRIAVSQQDENKLYACGIKSDGSLKFVIKSEDGGSSWQLLGTQGPLLDVLCTSDGTACQGWYDLCLAVHPRDDEKLFIGGQLSLFSYSKATGWKRAAFWASPARIGTNLVHADMHEFAFHPTNPDTMIVCTDGGNYLTFSAGSKFPFPSFIPRNKGFNVTQFYDIQANIYGDVLGGTQDNGTNLVSTTNASPYNSIQTSGGDGFDCAISAFNDYKMMFYTVYEGVVRRSINMDDKYINIIQGSCIENSENNAANVGFHTRIHLAEMYEKDEELSTVDVDIDKPVKSYLFVLNNSGIYASLDPTSAVYLPTWKQNKSIGGTPLAMHQTPDFKRFYVATSTGLYRATGMENLTISKGSVNGKNCDVAPLPNFNQVLSASAIGSVYVRQTLSASNHEVLATQYGFGSSGAKVYYSADGTTFQPKQGDLPNIPVYCGVIDENDAKHVIIGTEFGVFETDDITASSPKWVISNKNIGMVPVFRMRQVRLKKYGCWKVYAGTHGNGFYEINLYNNESCNDIQRGRNKLSASSIDPIINNENDFVVYPNPVIDKLSLKYVSNESEVHHISIYDQSGRMAKKINVKSLKGINHIMNIDVSSLSKGNYFIRLEGEKHVIGGEKFVIH